MIRSPGANARPTTAKTGGFADGWRRRSRSDPRAAPVLSIRQAKQWPPIWSLQLINEPFTCKWESFHSVQFWHFWVDLIRLKGADLMMETPSENPLIHKEIRHVPFCFLGFAALTLFVADCAVCRCDLSAPATRQESSRFSGTFQSVSQWFRCGISSDRIDLWLLNKDKHLLCRLPGEPCAALQRRLWCRSNPEPTLDLCVTERGSLKFHLLLILEPLKLYRNASVSSAALDRSFWVSADSLERQLHASAEGEMTTAACDRFFRTSSGVMSSIFLTQKLFPTQGCSRTPLLCVCGATRTCKLSQPPSKPCLSA